MSVRFATIGTSVITRNFAAATRLSGRATITVAHSRDRLRAQQFAAEIGAGRGESDLEAVLSADDVDAVYVASPNAAHAEHARAALAAGKHVLCEKPLVFTAAQAQELFDLARDRGVVLLEAMRSAFDPGMAAIRELLPTLGPVRLANLRYVQRSSRYERVLAGERVNIFDPAVGGGALFDLGVYVASPCVDLFGEPQTVTSAPIELPTGADGAGVIVAGYPGLVATLTYSKITASALPSEIQGEAATLVIDHISRPRRLRVEPLGSEPVEHVVDGTLDAGEDVDGNLAYEVVAFADLVESGQWPEGPTARSLGAARLIDAARASG